MDIKTKNAMVFKTALTGAVLLSFLNLSCRKLICKRHYYQFKVTTATVSPAKDSIKVGDTLLFSSVFSTQMKVIFDSSLVDYSGAINMGDVLGLKEVTGINGKSGAIPYFTIFPEIGKVYTDSTAPSPDMVKQTSYEEQNGFYKLKCGLIPHRPGIYGISIADLPNVAKECDRAAIVMQFSPDLDKHLHYLKNIYYGGGTVPSFDSTHVYCFKVYNP